MGPRGTAGPAELGRGAEPRRGPSGGEGARQGWRGFRILAGDSIRGLQ